MLIENGSTIRFCALRWSIITEENPDKTMKLIRFEPYINFRKTV